MQKKIIIFISALIIIPAILWASYPKSTGYVNDMAGVMQPATESILESLLSNFAAMTSNEIAVATIPELGNNTIEGLAVELFQEWGIGKKGKDNGVLFLIAPNDRKFRIEVGYGLEGVLNDALVGRIRTDIIIPYFKSGDMNKGIAEGAIALVRAINSKENLGFDVDAALGGYSSSKAIDVSPKAKKKLTLGSVIFFLLMAYLFIRHPWLFLFVMSASGGRGGGGGFGGGGGGFGGFGGGRSGGGGASGSW